MPHASSPLDVRAWLDSIGLSAYADAFASNDIDAETLPHLTAEDLREIGVTSVGHRRKLLAAIQSLAGAPPVPDTDPLVTVQLRQVTTLFCDLVGSTALTARLDPETMHDLLGAYKDVCTTVIDRFQGHVVRFIGDGLLASFGYPRAHEDDAARAVEAGLRLADRIAAITVPDGTHLAVRIGIATGMVVAGDQVGEIATERGALIGEAPNLAARLQSEAEPGQVLISKSTADLVSRQFICRPLGERSLKGFIDPVEIFQPRERTRAASRFEMTQRATDTLIIGRETETAVLLDRWDQACDGRGHVVVIAGEAGIGKSRLVKELHGYAEQTPCCRLTLQCAPTHNQTALYAIRNALEFVSAIQSSDPPEARAHKLEARLRAAGIEPDDRLPLLANLLQTELEDDPALEGLGPEIVRAQTVAALLGSLQALAHLRPTLIGIEDLHWADPSTAEALDLLIEVVADLSILVVVTTRPDRLPAWGARPHITTITLERLAPDDAARLITAIARPHILPPAFIDALVARSDGVPIFAEELTRAVLETEGAALNEGRHLVAIPATLNESLLARLDRLEHGRETAQLAAVIGREFPVTLLQKVSPLEPERLRHVIGRLLEAGILVRRHSTFGEALGFRHALMRDAAYQLMLQRERRRLHRRIADTLDTDFPDIARAMPQLLAQQLTDAEEFARAVDQWERAGTEAVRRSASAEAVAHLSQGLALIPHLPASLARDERELNLRLAIVGPMIAARGYTSDDVAREVDAAMELCRRLDKAHKAVPALMHKWLLHLGHGELDTGHDLAHELHEAARGGDDVDRLLGHRVLGSALLFRGELRRAVEQLGHFTALYDHATHGHRLARVGATDHALTVKCALAEAYWLLGAEQEAAEWRRAAIEEARASGHLHTACHNLAFAGGFVAALARDTDEVGRYAAELRALAGRHGLPFWPPIADALAGIAAAREGRVAEGTALAKSGLEKLRATRVGFPLPVLQILFAETCEETNQIEEADAALEAVAPAIQRGDRWLSAEFHRIRARARLAKGQTAAARHELEQAIAVAEKQGAAVFENRARTDLAALGPKTRRAERRVGAK